MRGYLRIIRAIVAGERNPNTLAQMRHSFCVNSTETIEQALTGHYREEHLFSLKQALELYDIYRDKIRACDAAIEQKLLEFSNSEGLQLHQGINKAKAKPSSKNAPSFDLSGHLLRLSGVDLLQVPGINSLSALALISEIGLDMSRWKNAKQFASWLGLCPGNKVSGGKRISGKSKPCANRAAAILRMAAYSLNRSSTALGGFLRRLKIRLGPAKAITATAHKLAKIIYTMLRDGISYLEVGQGYYEAQYRERMIRNLQRKAETLGFDIIIKGDA